MNKRVKRLIAVTLIISGFSIAQPGTYLSLMSTKAYGASYSLADRGELKSLDVKTTNGQELQLCDDYDGDNKPLTDETTYYVTMDDKNDGIKISGSVEGDDYVVKVFESDRDNATGHDLGENISIEKGTTTLYVRTYTSKDAYERAQDKEQITNCNKTYKIYVKKVSTKADDSIYLEDIKLEGGNIPFNFHREIYSYNIGVSEDDYDIAVRVRPEDEKYTVKINGFKVTDHDKYRKNVSLNKGNNEIKINITDGDYKNRTYTLNINRGGTLTNGQTSSNTSATGTGTSTENVSYNKWIYKNNTWQYNDSTGTPLKNTWFYDKSNNYYLKEDGSMAIGWLNNNGHWYYLDTNGAMKKGWQSINGNWYYLDETGIMQTGWLKDITGKWYYLQQDGSMAKSTVIEGYKLGTSGSLIN